MTKETLNVIKQILPKGTILDFGAGTGQLAEIWRSNYRINPICREIDPNLEEILKLKDPKKSKNQWTTTTLP